MRAGTFVPSLNFKYGHFTFWGVWPCPCWYLTHTNRASIIWCSCIKVVNTVWQIRCAETAFFFTDRLIYVAWSGGSTYTMLLVEPPLKKILYWSHSHWPLDMTSCAHGEEVLRQVVRQAVILTVSAVQKSCGCSGLEMTLIFKGSFQENWKVNF